MNYIKNKLLLIILVCYLFIAIIFKSNNNIIYTNVINPLFWLSMLIYLIWYLKSDYIRFSGNRKYFLCVTIISCMHIILYFYLGFIFGFGKSPYSHEIFAILKNIFIQVLPIISIEILRSVLANENKNNKLVVVFATILLILLEIDYSMLYSLISNKEDLFKYICGSIIPLISYSSLFMYLTLKGGYILPLLFRLLDKFTVLLLPILPNIDWFINGSICLLSSLLIYILFKYKLTKQKIDVRKKQQTSFAKFSYTVTLIFSVTLICFMLGFFKYQAISILSNSMVPTFNRGDVVIFQKLDNNSNINNGDIIVYSIEEQNIVHRVVNIIKENDNILYQTKGDSNNMPDTDLVQINQIQGIYVFRIKYLGFPSVLLYDFFNNSDSKVQIQ